MRLILAAALSLTPMIDALTLQPLMSLVTPTE